MGISLPSSIAAQGSVEVEWEPWRVPIQEEGLTIALNVLSDRQPRPVERLDREQARRLRDYLDSLPLD